MTKSTIIILISTLMIVSCSLIPSDDSSEKNNTVPEALIIDCANGGTRVGRFEAYDDIDYYMFSTKRGFDYVIRIIPENEKLDTFMQIFDNDGNLIRENDDGGIAGYQYCSLLQLLSPGEETLYIKLSNNSHYNGSYQIRIEENIAQQPELPMDPRQWNILVYLAADNDLTSDSRGDVIEMMRAGGSDENVNIILLWDEIEEERENGYRHGYYYITGQSMTLLKDLGEINMAEVGTATEFIDFATENFPAEKTLFIFWNHGSGIGRNVAFDQTSLNDSLSEHDQREIVNHLNQKTGRKVDIVAYDACDMGMLEVMYSLRGLADYSVASENTIPLDGYDYSFIRDLKLNPGMEAEELCGYIVDAYGAYYQNYSSYPVSLRAFDLSTIEEIQSSLISFAESIMNSGISTALIKEEIPESFIPYRGYLCLETFLANIAQSPSITNINIKEQAEEILEKMDQAHTRNFGSENSQYQAFTILYDTTPSQKYSDQEFCQDGNWTDFLLWAGNQP